MQEWFQSLFAVTLGWGDIGLSVGLVVSVILKIVIILIPLILTVAYLTYFERKVIGLIQAIEKVFPESSLSYELFQLLVGCRDDAEVYV